MDTSTNDNAPYARGEPTVKVFRHARERGLPNVIDSDTLERIGVGAGNGYQVMQALKFLGIITDEGRKGRPTDKYLRLHRASTEEYPSVLADLLRAAYDPIFNIVDPAQASIQQIHDAFRYYKPPGQRGRMVTLFIALCREAQIIPSDDRPRRIPATKRTPKAERQAKKDSGTKNGGREKPPDDSKASDLKDKEGINLPPPPPPLDTISVNPRYKLLLDLLEILPADGMWETEEDLEDWLAAVAATIRVRTKVKVRRLTEG
ncbi:MAG TPA: DUF5343 domain-containing protein [Chloroflexia bacterium]|nr:DUF5343 domain-containing protein [Chloroflexia bacterium]